MIHTSVADERAHLRIWERLPWLVNGTVSSSERNELEVHLRNCQSCREELTRQRELHAQMSSAASVGVPVEKAIACLLQQIEAQEEQASRAAACSNARRTPTSRWAGLTYGLAALVVLETAGLAVLGLQAGGVNPSAPVYRTLSTLVRSATQATIRLVVDATMPVKQLESLLLGLHLQIVGGPSENGVYSLGPASVSSDVERQIDTLRVARGVRFVEPVASGRDAP